MKFVGDTETTGLGGKDEVIQFAGFICDNGVIVDIVNFYCKPSCIIRPDSIKIHGITNKDIETLSEGKFFEECILEYPNLYKEDMGFIYYNASFDTRLIRQTMAIHGLKPFDFGTEVNEPNIKGRHYFCAMKNAPLKRVKLIDIYHNLALAKVPNLSKSALMDLTLKGLCNFLDSKGFKYDINRLKAHDALFDSYMLYLTSKELGFLNE